MPNPWGFGSQANDAAKPSAYGGNGIGRRARQGETGFGQRQSHLVLPLDWIGPAIDAVGSLAEPELEKFTKLEGGKSEPAALMPPEVPMSDEQLNRLSQYLERELSLCEGERRPYIEKLARLRYKYRTEFPDRPKNWPIANASQITIPVIKTAVNTTSSRLYQTLMAADPLIRVKTEDEDFADFAFDYEEFLKLYGEQILDLETMFDDYVSEVCMLGTGVVETTNWRSQCAYGRWDPSTGTFTKETHTKHSGPMVFHFPIEDFWIRPAHQNVQRAPWCGKELRLSWTEVKDMAFSGELNPEFIHRIARFEEGDLEVPMTKRIDEQVEKFEPNYRNTYTIYELCVRWDVDGDGLEEELLVYYHRPSRTILRRRFNGFYKGRRPWEVSRYLRIPHRFYGEGMAETLEHLQEEISTIHNQRLDNATIANLRIILVSKLIQGLRPGDRLWSGKIVKVTNVTEDVGTLQLGDIYPSTTANEQIAQGYVQQVSGVGEVATGQAQPVTRTTATAQLALLEELNRRFDKPLRGLRRTVKNMFNQLSDLFIEQGTGGLAEDWLGPERGMRVEAFLQLPPELINKKLKVTVSATRASNNREVEFQTQIAVMQLVNQMGEQMMRLTQGLAPQALGLVAHELIATVKPIFRKVMAYADAGDPDQAVAVLNVLERILPSPEDMGGMATARAEELAGMAGGAAPGTPGGPNNAGGVAAPEGVAGVANARRGAGQGGVRQPVAPVPAGGAY